MLKYKVSLVESLHQIKALIKMFCVYIKEVVTWLAQLPL